MNNAPYDDGPHTAEYVSLKEHFTALLFAQKDYFERLMEEQQKAVLVAAEAMNKRLDGMNEFRNSLRDQSMLFFSKAEHEQFRERIDREIKSLELSRAELKGKASQWSVYIFALVAVLGLILTIIDMVSKT